MNPLLGSLPAYPFQALLDRRDELMAAGKRVWDFAVGDPVEPTPEFIRTALVEAVEPVSQYPPSAGLEVLRQAVAAWVGRRFGVAVDPQRNVLATAGSKEAIFHLPLAILDPRAGRPAALWGEPGYPVYGRGQQFAGGTSAPVALREDSGWLLELGALDSGDLEEASIAWLNYPHNPTGAVADLDYYRRNIETARRHGIVLASDECYADIHPVDGAPPPSILQAADGDLAGIVVAFSLSKRSGMTGYRSGALVGDPDLIAAQRRLRPNLGTASPAFVQRAAVAAWGDEAHVAERRRVFDAKRSAVLGFLSAAGLRARASAATFYIWFAAPNGDETAYAEALLELGILASPGTAFGPAGRGWLRLALVPSLAACEEAMATWSDAIVAGRLPGHG